MRELSSFIDLIKDEYYNEIYSAVASFVEDNAGSLGCNSYVVEEPDEAELASMILNTAFITDSQGDEMLFDVVVASEIIIAETVKRNRESDNAEQWFRVSCKGNWNCKLQNFRVTDISIYRSESSNGKNCLSKYLVPIYKKEMLDEVAEDFLERYYPEALEVPRLVDAPEIARRLGLDLREIKITKDNSIFGQIYFSDCALQRYDLESDSYRSMDVTSGTIIVNPDVYFLRNLGSVNNTIIHECVHWDKHKRFFELQKLYNAEANLISCHVSEGNRPEENSSPLDWMEWQANALAPRILMPYKQTYLKANELISKYRRLLQIEDMLFIMEPVITELSEFFGVSKQAAKIRMIDLGYTDAIGVLNYVGDHYIANYSFDTESLESGKTFTIGAQDALREYAMNPEFRKRLNSGNYVYVDAHICINDPKYVRNSFFGVAELTDYARHHIDECCLVFDIEVTRNENYGVSHYFECVLYKDVLSERTIEARYKSSAENEAVEARAEQLRKIGVEAKETAEILRNLPTTFSGTLKAHMKRLDFTEELLEEKSLINERTIRRMRKNEKYQAKIPTIVAICVGMQLCPDFSFDLMRKSGNGFRTTEEHLIYKMILNSYYRNSIYECNEILEVNNCKPLSKEA